jgi:hypothetical protein
MRLSERDFILEFGKDEDGVADGIRTRNNKLHKLGLYH